MFEDITRQLFACSYFLGTGLLFYFLLSWLNPFSFHHHHWSIQCRKNIRTTFHSYDVSKLHSKHTNKHTQSLDNFSFCSYFWVRSLSCYFLHSWLNPFTFHHPHCSIQCRKNWRTTYFIYMMWANTQSHRFSWKSKTSNLSLGQNFLLPLKLNHWCGRS